MRGRTLAMVAVVAACSGQAVPEPATDGAIDAGRPFACLSSTTPCAYSASCCFPMQCIGGECLECVEPPNPCSRLLPCCLGSICVFGQCVGS